MYLRFVFIFRHKRRVNAKIKPPTEKRIMKWEMRNMLRTSSCIPIMMRTVAGIGTGICYSGAGWLPTSWSGKARLGI